MQPVFSEASWIWRAESEAPDSYCDFTDKFSYTKGNVTCHISCDGDYTLFVNGAYVSSNQYGDFEHYKIYDSIDITDRLVAGENTLFVTVWHLGIPSSRYKPAKAGLLYEVVCDGQVLCKSDAETLCRRNPNYKSEYGKKISPQLGQSFLFDATQSGNVPYGNSVVVKKECNMYRRPIQKSRLLDAKKVTILEDRGDHYLLDLGEESVGLPTLDFSSDVPQKITVCWGEHILDGGVRRIIGNRDFSFEYVATEGRNQYTNYMLRLGCRYLEVFCEAPIRLNYIGLIPQTYPAEVIPKTFDDPIKQKIYDTCVHTLQCCMMERYVDTPWREQSFYVYDARNQMLCGYKAFQNGNREYARAGLFLFGQDNREDDLLAITAPSGSALAIPSFSLHYFTAVREYVDNTGDLTLAEAVYDKLVKITRVFEKQMEQGLLVPFRDDSHWNFYDWSPYMNRSNGKADGRPDLMLNGLFVIALEHFRVISEKIGKPFLWKDTVEQLRVNIKAQFFDRESGLFSMTKDGREFTELGNSVAILAGVTTEEEGRRIARAMIDRRLEKCSLSMKCIQYDALLRVDPGYRENVVQDICNTYKVMLDAGATSVWEVLEGADAFDNAGSLCHGWSAIPILYL